MRHNIRTHFGYYRPDVEVLIDGRGWVPGEVRMQWQDAAGAWWAEVTFRSAHHSSEIESFPADRVRKDTVDRSSRPVSPETTTDTPAQG